MEIPFQEPEAKTEVVLGAKPNRAVEAIRGSWKKKPDEGSIVDAFIADRREQALTEERAS